MDPQQRRTSTVAPSGGPTLQNSTDVKCPAWPRLWRWTAEESVLRAEGPGEEGGGRVPCSETDPGGGFTHLCEC